MRREARILAKVSHPNIIYLFETITTTNRYYIITELVNGGDLCTYITSQRIGKLDEKQTRPLARQIISAVAHLHERGIVHRDLKMENILLDDAKENIKLVDFGLSNYRRGAELLHTHCGSPEYAAPELYVSGRQYGPEVDIWSLGVIFYGMLVGKLPFQSSSHKPGLTPEAKRKQLIRETKIGLTHRHQRNLVDISLLFQNLIERMLCPKPEDRITMLNLQAHAWIYGRFYREYPQVDGGWKTMAIARIAKMCVLPVTDVARTIETKRYSTLAGMFNIAMLAQLQRASRSEELRKRNKEIQKTNSIMVGLTHQDNRPSKNPLPVRTSQPPLHLKPQNPKALKITDTSCYDQLNTKKPEPKQRPKTPFNIATPATPQPRHCRTGFGGVISRMLHKHKAPRGDASSTSQQKEETLLNKKVSGIPMHTAVRAAARAELEKRPKP